MGHWEEHEAGDAYRRSALTEPVVSHDQHRNHGRRDKYQNVAEDEEGEVQGYCAIAVESVVGHLNAKHTRFTSVMNRAHNAPNTDTNHQGGVGQTDVPSG